MSNAINPGPARIPTPMPFMAVWRPPARQTERTASAEYRLAVADVTPTVRPGRMGAK